MNIGDITPVKDGINGTTTLITYFYGHSRNRRLALHLVVLQGHEIPRQDGEGVA